MARFVLVDAAGNGLRVMAPTPTLFPSFTLRIVVEWDKIWFEVSLGLGLGSWFLVLGLSSCDCLGLYRIVNISYRSPYTSNPTISEHLD